MSLGRNGLEQAGTTARLQNALTSTGNRVIKLAFKAWTMLPPVITGHRWPNVPRLTGDPLVGQFTAASSDGGRGNSAFITAGAQLALQHPSKMSSAYILHNSVLFLTNPTHITQLNHHERDFDRSISHAGITANFGDDNVFSRQSDELHSLIRRIAKEYLFNDEGLNNLSHAMAESMTDFLSKNLQSNQNKIFNAEHFFKELVINVFIQVVCGANPISKNDFGKLNKAYLASFQSAISHKTNFLIQLAKILRMKKNFSSIENLKENLHQLLREIILNEENVKKIRGSKNLLIMLAQMLENEGKPTAQKEQKEENNATSGSSPKLDTPLIMDNLAIILFAASSTLSKALPFIFALLADHSHVKEKVKCEINENRPRDNKWTHEDIKKMTYLRRVVDESLRLYSVAGVILKAPTKEITIADFKEHYPNQIDYENALKDEKRSKDNDVKVSRGDFIVIPTYVTHRAKENFPQPDRFEPDRFVPGNPLYQKNPGSYFPFSTGPRNCLGMNYANELIIQMVITMQDYMAKNNLKLEFNQHHPFDVRFLGLLETEEPLKFQSLPTQKTAVWPQKVSKPKVKPSWCELYRPSIIGGLGVVGVGLGAAGVVAGGAVVGGIAAAATGLAVTMVPDALVKRCARR